MITKEKLQGLNDIRRKTREMKPVLGECPWCGNKEVFLDVDISSGEPLYYVDCQIWDCNRIQVDFYETPEEAIEAWNSIERRGENGG